MTFSPIFIVGVPRSGTTLLRVLLDSHSQILALPETPWVSGAYGGPLSLRHLLLDLAEGPYGAQRNVAGIERTHILQAGAGFLEQLFEPALKARGKRVLAFKTPSDIPHLEFLTTLLPDARYIHITRDGRDVALSQLSKRGSFFLQLRGYKSLSYANVFRRWVEWETMARDILNRGGLSALHLRYEELIADPEGQMRRVTAFLGLPFEQRMLDYTSHSHDYPKWEAGSTDVAGHRGLSGQSVEKWRRGKKSIEILYTLSRHDDVLIKMGYCSSDLRLGPGRRVLVFGYGLIRPILEIASLLANRVHPMVRSRGRVLACFWLFLLAAWSFAPAAVQDRAGLVHAVIGPLLSFGATLSVTLAFLPVIQRFGRAGYGPAFVRAATLMLAFVALLQAGHFYSPDWRAALHQLVLSGFAILVGLIAAMPLVFKTRQRADPTNPHPTNQNAA